MIESVLEPLFHKTSTKKHWTFAEVGTNFEIHENNISFESLSYYQSICDADRLEFGRCTSAHLSVEFLNIALELTGRTFDVSFTFEDEPNTPFVLGRFTVTEDKPSPDRKSRSVTMYDALYFIQSQNYASWYNAITDNQWSSMTLGGFIDSFLSHVSITAESASRALLVNASMPVSKTIKSEQLLGSDILYAVCQAAGCFGVMTYDNKFRFLYLKSEIEGLFPANDLYPADDLYPIEPVTTYIPNSEYYPPLVYETFMTPSITKLRIAESTEDAGTAVGSGDAGYEIIGNFLFAGKTAQQLNTYGANTLGAMTQRNYRPYSVEKMGNLCFEIGDPIRLGNEDMSVESYILTRTFKGVQAFTDEISAEGSQDYATVANSISTMVDKLQSKTAVLRQDVDEVSTTMTEELALDGVVRQGTYAYQTNNKIGAKVDIEYGNHTTDSFSWDMDITGHAWYKGNQQVMKVDGNGLTVTGTIQGSEIIVGTAQSHTMLVKDTGNYMILGGSLALFDAEHDGQYTVQFVTDDFTTRANNKVDMTIGDTNALYAESNYISQSDTYETKVCLGCDKDGDFQANKVAINASDWIHIGVQSPKIYIGQYEKASGYSGSTDIRIRAKDFSQIQFQMGYDGTGGTVTTKTLQSILNDISSASSTANSAYNKADACTTAILAINQSLGVISQTVANHEARITALENA